MDHLPCRNSLLKFVSMLHQVLAGFECGQRVLGQVIEFSLVNIEHLFGCMTPDNESAEPSKIDIVAMRHLCFDGFHQLFYNQRYRCTMDAGPDMNFFYYFSFSHK